MHANISILATPPAAYRRRLAPTQKGRAPRSGVSTARPAQAIVHLMLITLRPTTQKHKTYLFVTWYTFLWFHTFSGGGSPLPDAPLPPVYFFGGRGCNPPSIHPVLSVPPRAPNPGKNLMEWTIWWANPIKNMPPVKHIVRLFQELRFELLQDI